MNDTVIFVDFDGVLHTENYDAVLYQRGETLRDAYGSLFDPAAVRSLATIVEATGAGIVISSSWRYIGTAGLEEIWQARRMPGRIVGSTPLLSRQNLQALIGDDDEIERALWEIRGWEIHAYLLMHPEVEHYVILDDETCMRPYMMEHFVAIDEMRGITAHDAERAIEMLAL